MVRASWVRVGCGVGEGWVVVLVSVEGEGIKAGLGLSSGFEK